MLRSKNLDTVITAVRDVRAFPSDEVRSLGLLLADWARKFRRASKKNERQEVFWTLSFFIPEVGIDGALAAENLWLLGDLLAEDKKRNVKIAYLFYLLNQGNLSKGARNYVIGWLGSHCSILNTEFRSLIVFALQHGKIPVKRALAKCLARAPKIKKEEIEILVYQNFAEEMNDTESSELWASDALLELGKKAIPVVEAALALEDQPLREKTRLRKPEDLLLYRKDLGDLLLDLREKGEDL